MISVTVAVTTFLAVLQGTASMVHHIIFVYCRPCGRALEETGASSLLAFSTAAMPRKNRADRVRCPGCSREMTLGSLLDTHLKGSSQCRTAYEAAEEEKRKANSARLFGRALTTEPPNKPDGAG